MSTPTEDSLEPGPDGKLISTEERMQIIQQQQQPETTPEKAAPVEGTTGPPLTVHTISTLFFFSSSLGLGVVVLLGVSPPAFYVVWLTRYSRIVSKYFLVKTSNFFLCYSAEIFVDNGDVDVICVVDKDAWQIFEPVCSLNT